MNKVKKAASKVCLLILLGARDTCVAYKPKLERVFLDALASLDVALVCMYVCLFDS